MLVCVDLDGTIDADPGAFCALLTALRAAGHTVDVVTGTPAPTDSVLGVKQAYLSSLGCAGCYDRLVVIPYEGKDLAAAKARYAQMSGAGMAIDNNTRNCKAYAAVGVLALCVWNTKSSD